MFENTYVGKFFRKPKNSIPPMWAVGGSRKTPKTAFFELSENFTAKPYVEIFLTSDLDSAPSN